jgi:hypothetical protein
MPMNRTKTETVFMLYKITEINSCMFDAVDRLDAKKGTIN